MFDLAYPLRAVLGNIQHAHNTLKNVESYHLGRIYTDSCNFGYNLFEPIVKPIFDFVRNHKVPTAIVGTVIVLAVLAHPKRPPIDPADQNSGKPPADGNNAGKNQQVGGDGGETSENEGSDGEGAGAADKTAAPPAKAPATGPEASEGEGEEEEGGVSGAAGKPAAPPAKAPATGPEVPEGKGEEEEGEASGAAGKPAPDAPPASGADRKEPAAAAAAAAAQPPAATAAAAATDADKQKKE